MRAHVFDRIHFENFQKVVFLGYKYTTNLILVLKSRTEVHQTFSMLHKEAPPESPIGLEYKFTLVTEVFNCK